MPDDPLYLWAKKAKKGKENPLAFHPLLCHLLDVGAVAEQLWTKCLPPSARAWFAQQIDLDVESAGRWATFLAATHDLGKASKVFNEQIRHGAARHGTISTFLLESALQQSPFEIPQDVASRLATVVGGHHGAFPRSLDIKQVRDDKDQAGRGRWKEHRQWLLDEIARMLEIPGTPPPSRLTNAGAIWLAGFISVADWIGSNQEFFPYAEPGGVSLDDFSIDAYAVKAHEQAARAIAALGWGAWPAQSDPRTFADLFPDIGAPNAMQDQVIRLAKELREPFLVIIEAPMGMGKTEAALYLADHANVNLGMRGHYVALPTQATSNQMFSRDKRFLEQRYPNEIVNTQLLHGHAALDSELVALKEAAKASLASFLDALDIPLEDHSPQGGEAGPGVIAAEWFTYRKRGLLAPFGVGTIDQALLAVLQTKHFFVRLLGLAGKTIVFDEVHAYDTYMSVLLERLLEWLAALGCSVVLLSATLPAARRESLLRAWSGEKAAVAAADCDQVTYPAITWRSGSQRGTIHFKAPEKTVRLRWMKPEEGSNHHHLGSELAAALQKGGCAAVICNTVKRAQEVYTALREHFTAEELSLFHARFLHGERMTREREALRRFGKPGKDTQRPQRAVIVATQVLEQSLDLDFDLMVTELAPVDLVLQRSGRLHRHDRERPPGLEQAELWLLAPTERDSLPAFPKRDLFVYDTHILLRSWLALRDRSEIIIPRDVTPLIEEVYTDNADCPADGPPDLPPLWERTLTDVHEQRARHESLGKDATIYPPQYRESGFLEQRNKTLEEDDPGTHETLRALTRLGEANITAICLTPEEVARLQPRAPDSGQRAAEFLHRSVNLTHGGIVQALIDDGHFLPSPWKRTALLRHCRLVELNEHKEAPIGDYHLRIDPELGVVVN